MQFSLYVPSLHSFFPRKQEIIVVKEWTTSKPGPLHKRQIILLNRESIGFRLGFRLGRPIHVSDPPVSFSVLLQAFCASLINLL